MERFDTDALLQHAGFLRALARSLVGDEHRADDAVQEAYAAAWERRADLRNEARGWLATVAANAARMLRRGEDRRRRRERQASRPEKLPDTGTTAARLEMNRLVIEAVQSLAEPYRSTVVARYFDGATAREVAARDGVAIKTVHSRLDRAMAQLRAHLDRSHGRGAWTLALAPWLAAREAPAAAAATVTGAIVMKTKIALAAAVVLIAMLGWYALDRSGRATPERSTPRAEAPAAAEATTKSEPARNENGPAAPGAGGKDRPLPEISVSGTILQALPDKTPVKLEAYRVSQHGNTFGDPVRTEAEADGGFEIDLSKLFQGRLYTEFEVRADHPRHMPVTMRAQITRRGGDVIAPRVMLPLEPAAVVRGFVKTPDGAPVAKAHAALFAWDGARPTGRALETVRTDATGAYWLRAAKDDDCCVVAIADGWRPAHVTVAAKLREVVDAPPLALRAGVTIAGRITVNGAAPGGEARARASRKKPSKVGLSNCVWGAGAFVRTSAFARADESGHYKIAGLAPGPWNVSISGLKKMHADVWQIGRQSREATAPTAGVDFDVSSATIVLHFVRDGAPAAQLHPMLHGKTSVYHYSTDSQGRIEVAVAPEIPMTVTVNHPGYEPFRAKFRTPGPGRRAEHRFALKKQAPRATLTVRLRGADVVRAGFGFFAGDATAPLFTRDAESAAGPFVLRDLKPGTYRVRVHAGAFFAYPFSYFLPAEAPVTLPEGGDAELVFDMRRGGRLRLSTNVRCQLGARDGAGRTVPLTTYEKSRGGGWTWSEGWTGEGTDETGPALPAGIYRLTFSRKGYRTVEREVTVREGETTPVTVKLEPASR